jgi:CubicO group peptidase (beta-lactamase class C family)
VERWVDDGVIPGAGVWIGRAGERVAEAYLGVADPTSGRPVTRETVWSVASVTKPLTAAVVMRAVQLGLMTLDEPISRLVPELVEPSGEAESSALWTSSFARAGVTVRQCLSHSSGLPGFGAENMELRRARRPLADFVTAFAQAPLIFEPGTAHLYSNCGILMAAEAAGRAIGGGPGADGTGIDAFRDEFGALLSDAGMRSSALVPPEAWLERIAAVVDTGQAGEPFEMANSAYYRSLGIPWGGLFTTPRDLGRWLRTFVDAPVAVTRVLTAASVRQMMTVQSDGPDTTSDIPALLRDGAADAPRRARVEWGLGWEIKGAKRSHPSGDLTSPRTISHLGASGTMVWLDPSTGVQFVLLTNRTLVSGWTRDRHRLAMVSNAVMGAL